MMNARKLMLGVAVSAIAFGASGMAQAQEADTSGQGLAEIVVTAQKRETKLETTPATINVVGGEQLANMGVVEIKGLAANVPGFTMHESPGGLSGVPSAAFCDLIENLAEVRQGRPGARRRTRDPSRGPSMTARILVIDDEEIVLRSCQRILAGDAYAVDVAGDSREGLRRADDGNYDLILLDIKMPHLDGIEVLRDVKERHPDIEVIMVTGLTEVQTAVRAMKLGAFDYLSKPVASKELVAFLNELQWICRIRGRSSSVSPEGSAA